MSNWCLAAKEDALAAVLSAVCLSVPCENGIHQAVPFLWVHSPSPHCSVGFGLAGKSLLQSKLDH